jgi:hypothetical protein
LKNALVKDGWTITHDPLTLKVGRDNLFVDLGAEKLLTAEKEGRKIAVELKTFVGASEVREMEQAFGQYFVYRAVIEETKPERKLYLALTQEVFRDLFEDDLGELLLRKYRPPMIIFDPEQEAIVEWRE